MNEILIDLTINAPEVVKDRYKTFILCYEDLIKLTPRECSGWIDAGYCFIISNCREGNIYLTDLTDRI